MYDAVCLALAGADFRDRGRSYLQPAKAPAILSCPGSGRRTLECTSFIAQYGVLSLRSMSSLIAQYGVLLLRSMAFAFRWTARTARRGLVMPCCEMHNPVAIRSVTDDWQRSQRYRILSAAASTAVGERQVSPDRQRRLPRSPRHTPGCATAWARTR